MRSRPQLLRRILWIVVALIGHFGCAQSSNPTFGQTAGAHPASFSFATDHEPVISLDGLWRFHPGDDARWASPTFDDSAWPLLRSDEPWTTQGYNNLSGFAWYRFRVQAPSPAIPLALLLPSILTDYEVFENGARIGGFGQMPPHGSMRFNQRLLYPVAPANAGATLQFAIRVWHHPIFATYLGGGPRYAGAYLGKDTLVERQFGLLKEERLTQIASFFAVGILNAVVSVTVFGLYLYRRSEREYLWFAILLLTSAVLAVLTISDFILNFPLGLRDFLAETLGALGLAAALFFFSRVLEARRSLVWRAVLLLALLDPLNVALYLFRLTSPATSTSLRILFDLPIEVYIVALLCGRAIAGNRNARLLFVPTILLYGTGILGGAFLLSFQLHGQVRALASIVEADTLIILGDVAGKGLPAAMTVSLLVGALRSLVETTGSPAKILAGLNRRLLGRGSGFTTCLAIRLSPSGTLTLANAGHLAPYRNGQELPSQPALPLGLDPNAEFAEEIVQLVHGDRLTLLTDGVPEATCRRELFGFEQTARISSLSAAEIAQAALRFGQEDDITVISIVTSH
jgi:Stage II sporulation protein E (SpoIIE)